MKFDIFWLSSSAEATVVASYATTGLKVLGFVKMLFEINVGDDDA